MDGWIKVHRQILNNPLWLSEKFTRGQAWVDLILLANHEDGFFYLRDHKITVKRGQVGWSYLKLSLRWKWSRSKVKKFINDLEKEQQVLQQQSKSTSIITIINYDKYQQKEQQKDNRKTTERQQKDTNKNDKNDKNDKNKNIVNEKIVDYFHSTCPDLPKVQKLTNQRKSAINARIREYNFETVLKVIDLASASKFLNGDNSRNWTASFDWMLKPGNFTKILENNYQNKEQKEFKPKIKTIKSITRK